LNVSGSKRNSFQTSAQRRARIANRRFAQSYWPGLTELAMSHTPQRQRLRWMLCSSPETHDVMLQPLQPYGDAIAKAVDPACELGHDTASIGAGEVAGAAKPRPVAILRSLVVRGCHAPSSSVPFAVRAEPSLLRWPSHPVRVAGGKGLCAEIVRRGKRRDRTLNLTCVVAFSWDCSVIDHSCAPVPFDLPGLCAAQAC
jgi:hypothetical protein